LKKVLFIIFLLGIFIHGATDMEKEVYSYYENWKQTYVVAEKSCMYRIATDKKDKHRTVSEGQGYGMLITSMIDDKDAQKIFDGLYLFSRVHSSSISKDLMAWQIPEVKCENDSAFDGDADIAYALIVADKRWGSKGFVNYKKEAQKVLNAIYKHTIGKQSFLPLLGDWVDENGKKFNQYTTRTSDFMIGHFKAFARFTGDKKWLKVATSVQHATVDVQHPKTGLVPDFIRYDKKLKKFVAVKEGFLEHKDGEYYYNACRVPFRIGVDALLNGDKTSKKIVQKLSHWVKTTAKNNPINIKSGFKLDGTVIGDYFSIVFVAPFGVASMVDDKVWSKKIYDTVKTRHENYYEDSVALLSMMVMGGLFIDPTKTAI
jgi:endo-1,4-beta-D-glucanase Y